jgi:hypothetical protein
MILKSKENPQKSVPRICWTCRSDEFAPIFFGVLFVGLVVPFLEIKSLRIADPLASIFLVSAMILSIVISWRLKPDAYKRADEKATRIGEHYHK